MPELAGEEHVKIAAPAAEVWAYRLRFANLPEYNPDVSDVQRVADGRGAGGEAGVGARYRFTLATAHGPHPVTLAVTGVTEGEEVSATMEGGLAATETFRVVPLAGGECRATLSLWLALPPGLPPETGRRLLAGGRDQIRAELDAMRAVFAGRRPPGTTSGEPGGA